MLGPQARALTLQCAEEGYMLADMIVAAIALGRDWIFMTATRQDFPPEESDRFDLFWSS